MDSQAAISDLRAWSRMRLKLAAAGMRLPIMGPIDGLEAALITTKVKGHDES